VVGIGRRRTLLLDDLRNRRRYWKLKEEAEDRKKWKQQFAWTKGRNASYLAEVHGPSNKQYT
jgi:hypothetical protein